VELRIRPGTERDAGAIARVQTLGWQQGHAGLLPADWLARRVIDAQVWSDRLAHPLPRSTLFVAEVSDEEGPDAVVGYTLVGPAQAAPDPGGTVGQLYAIYVLAEHWGDGAGHRLHEAGMDALTAAGYRTARLWVLAGNARAIAFYERHGWSDDQTLRTEDLGGVTGTLHRFSRSLS
jgi:GNAT superfamily N-acetyltransferase